MSCIEWVLDQLTARCMLLINIQNNQGYPEAVREAARVRMRRNVGVFRYLKEEQRK
jgi:hypothetical protein